MRFNKYKTNTILQSFETCVVLCEELFLERPKRPLKFNNIMATPVLLYGSECWPLTEQVNAIEIVLMCFLRVVAG
jgi:hypothetical protein